MTSFSTRRPTAGDADAIARLSGELGYPTRPTEIHTRLTELAADAAQCGFYERAGYQRAKTQHAFRKILDPSAAELPTA